MSFFDRKQSDCDKRIVSEQDWHSFRNGEVRAVIAFWEEGFRAQEDLRYEYSVAFYGNSPNYPHANGKHAWIKNYAELEVFLEMARNNELVELRTAP